MLKLGILISKLEFEIVTFIFEFKYFKLNLP